jgi:hypothetical protein
MPKKGLVPLLVVGVCLLCAWCAWVVRPVRDWVSALVQHPVRGVVIDQETGEPLSGAELRIGTDRAVSGPDGGFEFHGVKPPLEVTASAAGYLSGSAHVAPPGRFRTLGTLQLELEPVELTGTVLDSVTSLPLEGALLASGSQVVRTDSTGRYRLTRLVKGAVITVTATLHQDGEPALFDSQASLDWSLVPLPVEVSVRDASTDRPLAGAEVSTPLETARTAPSGVATLVRTAPQNPISVTLAGFTSAQAAAAPGDRVTVRLKQTMVSGTVRAPDGSPLAKAQLLLRTPNAPTRWVYTDATGRYTLTTVPDGASLTAKLPGYALTQRSVSPGADGDFQLQRFAAKALYIPFGLLFPVQESRLKEDLALVDRTELNALVIDVKGDMAWLAYSPQYTLAKEIDAGYEGIDVRTLLAQCKKQGIYTIARIVTFKDNVLGTKRPEWAVHHKDGRLWKDDEDLVWVDPFRKEVWEYNLGIAREVVEMGFDEVQMDYVRFPSDGAIGDTVYSQESNAESRSKAIGDFLAFMRKGLEGTGAFLSCDLFGLVTSMDPDYDLGVGQRLRDIAPWVDYFSPMVYPSTYISGNLGLADPWREPYKVVKIALDDARERTTTLVRPWLQHYSLWGVEFGTNEFRLEKKAAADGGGCGWIFWNAAGIYDPEAFDRE